MGLQNSTSIPPHPNLPPLTTIHSQSQPYLLLTLTLPSLSDITRFKSSSSKLSTFNQQHIFSPIAVHFEEPSSSITCGDMAVVKLFYPYYPYNLEVEIERRRESRVRFKEKEVWYLLYSLVRVCRQFEKEMVAMGGVEVGDVLLNELGEMKMVTKHSIPEGWDSEKILEKQRWCLSPEEMKSQKQNKLKPTLKMPVFSAGLILLSTLSLQPPQDFYNRTLSYIDIKSLHSTLHQLSQHYPPLLTYIIQKMLAEDPRKRPYFQQIDSLLSPYASSIDESQLFEVDIKASYQNLLLFHNCFKSYQSGAFVGMVDDLQRGELMGRENKGIIRNKSIERNPVYYRSERFQTPGRMQTKPFISTRQRTPNGREVGRPLYEQNYYKLKRLEQKRELSVKRI